MTKTHLLNLATKDGKAFIIADMYGESMEWELKPVRSKHHKTPDSEDTRAMANRIVGVFQAVQTLTFKD